MRAQDQHLSAEELARLAHDGFSDGSPQHREDLEQHVRACTDCAALLDAQKSLAETARSSRSSRPAAACADEHVWLEYAAGLRREEAFQLTAHAAQCGPCADQLKSALRLMQTIPSEQIFGAGEGAALESSRREWQQKLARRMAAERRASAAPRASFWKPRTSFWSPRRWSFGGGWLNFATPALAGLLLVAGGALAWRQVHPSEARLLAEAYNHERVLPLRIAGADPVPLVSITRSGGAGAHDTREPSELIELRLRAQKNLEKTPDSPYWHQVMGEINLLDRDALSARRNLEIAQASDPNLPGLQPDLAAAWYELGDASGDAVDYTHATELYLRELRSLGDGTHHPQNPALLHYNLALCWERLNVTESALSELRASLAAEKSSAWRDAIQREIQRLSANSKLTGNPLDHDGYEDVVVASIAAVAADPAAIASPSTLQAAGLGLTHGDPWITDWTHPARLLRMHEADTHLAAATHAGLTGDNASGLREANAAFALYTAEGNRAGALRAQYSALYSDQRLGLDDECIQAAEAIRRAPDSRRYPILYARTLLMESACAGRDRDFARADALQSEAIEVAAAHHLPQVMLYSVNARLQMLHVRGENSASLREGVAALHLCRELPCDANRRYTFLLLLMYATNDLGLRLTGEAAMRAGAEVAQSATDIMSRAYAWDSLGRIATEAGDFAVAEDAFRQGADVVAAQHTPAASIYRADWALDRAAMLTREARAADALHIVEQNTPAMLATTYVPGLIKLHQQASLAQLALGHPQAAVQESLAAVQATEQALASLPRKPQARDQWAREQTPVYRQLVRAYLAEGRAADALQAWERFRSLPGGTAIAPEASPAATSVASPAPRLLRTTATSSTPASNSQVLVIARAGDDFVGWSVSPDGHTVLRSTRLGAADALQQQAATLYHLCADRDSRLVDVQHIGSLLFAELLAPLLDTAASAPRSLFLDLDPTLSALPLDALRTPSGEWLSERFDAAVLPAWWTLAPRQSLASAPLVKEGRALLVDALDGPDGSGSELAAIAPRLPSAVRLTGASITSAELRSRLPAASLFHFTGHTDLGGTALLRAGTNSEPVLTPESMNGLRLPHCRLAVLAACNTNSSDPELLEKAPDLRNSLLLAGAQRVVASNWDVDDRSTRSLMIAFYNQMDRGRPPAEALAAAQREIRSISDWQHPYYWAGFELYTR